MHGLLDETNRLALTLQPWRALHADRQPLRIVMPVNLLFLPASELHFGDVDDDDVVAGVDERRVGRLVLYLQQAGSASRRSGQAPGLRRRWGASGWSHSSGSQPLIRH